MASKATGPQCSPCPSCKKPLEVSSRYPNRLCWACTCRATDAHGRLMKFGVGANSREFEARFADDKSFASEVTKNHTVYVGSLKAWADEAHMGGVVLTPYRESHQRPRGTCPVCHDAVPIEPRYPNLLCGRCCGRAVDYQGRALTFHNASPSGGFEARFEHDGSLAREVTEHHTVYVGFLKVWADEARLGGYVLTPFREPKQ